MSNIVNVSKVVFPLSFMIGSIFAIIYAIDLLIHSNKKDYGIPSKSFRNLFLVLLPSLIVFYFAKNIISFLNYNWLFFISFCIILMICGIFWTKFSWLVLMTYENEVKYIKKIKMAKEQPINEENKYYSVPEGSFRECVEDIIANTGLKNIELFFCSGDNINAGFYDKKTLVFTEVCKRLSCEEVVALVGHEIIHLNKKKDGFVDGIIKQLLVMIIPWCFIFAYFLTAYNLIILKSNFSRSTLTLITPIFVGISVFTFMYVFGGWIRFWRQIEELRADRLVCKIKDVNKQGMIRLLNKLKENQKVEYDKLPFYKKVYIRYFNLIRHPNIEYRIDLIKNYKEWSCIIDYIKHFLVMTKWFITGKGWYGL